MLFNKYNRQILYELDQGALGGKPETSKTDSLKNTKECEQTKYAELLKIIDKQCKEIAFLKQKVSKTVDERNALNMKIKERDQELQEANTKCCNLSKALSHTKMDLENSLKENKSLQKKLNGIDRWKERVRTVSDEKEKALKKCNRLEQTQVKNQMLIKNLQQFIVPFSRGNQDREANELMYHDFLRKHVVLQKEYEKKVNDLSKKELLLKEKDEKLTKFANAEKGMKLKELTNKSIENKRKIKMQAVKIKVLTTQLNMCEAAVAAYKSELEKMKQRLKTKLTESK
ncbi:hypothetical protein TNIN_375691 [Trichonephila inaurata madagascariensis]|uniref:Uncharacterized protein n=1 Tax=Trichonephila inaurata madagascariensis TaxID=2747483 RepID=A0A8X6IMS3_9ARAC|nr:hypothetical protein TNIN_375691 [Trichonephila inaurata madagascariensis]